MSLTNQIKAERFLAALRHCQILGLTVEQVTEDRLQMRLPYSEKIIGDPLTGVLHGGGLTTLMDTACGTLVFTSLPDFELCPTLDLRMDYMKAATAGQDVIAHAEIVRIAKSVVFTACKVYQEDGTLVARCGATFMRIGAHMTPPEFRRMIEEGVE